MDTDCKEISSLTKKIRIGSIVLFIQSAFPSLLDFTHLDSYSATIFLIVALMMLASGIFGLKASKPDLDQLGVFTCILVSLKVIYLLALLFFLVVGGICFFSIPECNPPQESCINNRAIFTAIAISCGFFSVILIAFLATIFSSLRNSLKLKELLIKEMVLLDQ